jgi:hypothetical protein
MRLVMVLGALAAAAAGWFLGISEESSVSANQGVSIHVYSGALYGASYLTCGWHQACSGSPNYERGLDFATPTFHPDKSGYFTGWGFSGDAQDTVRATGTVGHDTPFMGCTSTSVDVRDTFGAIQIRLYYVHVQQGNFGTFNIYAKQFGLGGHWNGDVYVGNQIIQPSCDAPVQHTHTWYDGMVGGVINILPRDYFWNCPNSGGFYFPCFNITPYQLPHDLNDWEYVMYW